MKLPTPIFLLATLLACGVPQAVAQDSDDDLAKVKERELEAVRDRISALKRSMDERSETRDRVTRELQSAEVVIAQKRKRLKRSSQPRIASWRKLKPSGTLC